MHYGAEWEWKVRACSSKRICMAGWMLLWKQWACKIFISTGSVHGSPWPAGWSSGSSICYFPFAMALQPSLFFKPLWRLLSLSIHLLYGSSFPCTLVNCILCLLTSCGSTKSPFIFFTFASWLSSFLLLIAPYCFNDYSELWPLVHIQRMIKVHGHPT